MKQSAEIYQIEDSHSSSNLAEVDSRQPRKRAAANRQTRFPVELVERTSSLCTTLLGSQAKRENASGDRGICPFRGKQDRQTDNKPTWLAFSRVGKLFPFSGQTFCCFGCVCCFPSPL